jgi:hypothetical protein
MFMLGVMLKINGMNILQKVDLIGDIKMKGLVMNRYTILLAVLLLCNLSTIQTQAQPEHFSDIKKEFGSLEIVLTSFEINNKILRLSYEIENNSDEEVWICEDIGFDRFYNSEICFTKDNQLITIRRRLDVFVPSGFVWARRPLGKYVRLYPGQKRHESLSVNVPLDGHIIFGPRRYDQIPKNLFYVSHLAIEIGYFVGNLPEIIHNKLLEAEKIHNDNNESAPQILTIFGDALTFNYFREQLRDRKQEVVIPYNYQQFKGEKVLRTTIDGLRIPCQNRRGRNKGETPRSFSPDFSDNLRTCTKLEICYKHSALEYFFPLAINQSILSHEEIEYLQSEQTFVIEDRNIIKSFAKEITDGSPFYGIVNESNIAHFDCYNNNEHLTSFTTYGDLIVEAEEKLQLLKQKDSLSIGMLPPEIQKLQYRVQCAINLRNLYYRLRLYNLIIAKQQNKLPVKDVVIYPNSTDWFDALISIGYFPKSVISIFVIPKLDKPHVCPSVGEGRSTYAMNPNCEPNSPGDMVLLFETKAGWNQHGGPELFTFDNHDPKGGCVLLNDGTVKFIRTKEELQQLRWK